MSEEDKKEDCTGDKEDYTGVEDSPKRGKTKTVVNA